ncbi:ABC transporter ATP-binding protein [Trebonia kvetii]|uniref:ABC transporter ATP-binding protein n=1 Tax=Trebonia kvetii TaxID=2480626 RepID=A0A6P2C2H1_9ACTN|nr:ABC transporter ATP-binding protein [Trebonia kvetii]
MTVSQENPVTDGTVFSNPGSDNPVLAMTDAAVEYRRHGQRVRALDGVDLTVARGEVVGLVGESGCGKSTLARAAVGLVPLAAGTVSFEGEPVAPLGMRRRPGRLRGLQMVFQDPYESLNPRRKVGELIADGVLLGGGSRSAGRARAVELLERVGLPATAADGYPHEFSGGQRQRIAIARTLAAKPSCLIADEPISALDASAQAQIANLLTALVREEGIGLLLVSHDLSVVRQVADRVAVMYLGRIVESGETAEVWSSPNHPYTEALVAAIPRADGAGVLPADLPGDVPDPASPPSGCRFHPRCPIARDECASTEQRLVPLGSRAAACHVRAPLPGTALDPAGAGADDSRPQASGAASLCGLSTRTSSTCWPARCCPRAPSRSHQTARSPRSRPPFRPACRTGR